MTADPARTPSLPPDPAQYDAERNVHARKRGLPTPYIAGGNDPDLPATLRRERTYVRLLVAMIVAIVVIGFALGFVEAALGIPAFDVPAI